MSAADKQILNTLSANGPTIYINQVTEGDNPAAIYSVETTTNYGLVVRARIVGGGSGTCGAWEIVGTFRNLGGVVTQIGTTTVVFADVDGVSSNMQVTPTFSIFGTTIQVIVDSGDQPGVWSVNADALSAQIPI